ncbi:MAG TPA: MarR family transcriptional regulator [Dehalococcoidia bacterium]|nr:MarR family transcriptional regulator [Dehalococcoidia bacterium]
MPAKSPAKAPGAPTFMDPGLMPWVLVSELYWMSDKLLDRRLYRLGVSASQARVLAVLYNSQEPMKISAVATLLFQEAPSITGILHRIELRDWVVRTPDPNDLRVAGLQLTATGRRITMEIVAIMRELYDELFGAVLGSAERRRLESGLRRIRAIGFTLPEADAKLRRAQQYGVWTD